MTLSEVVKKATGRLFSRVVRSTEGSTQERCVPVLTLLEAREVPAVEWLGPIGIQSAALGLTGKDVAIGQIEMGRPGIANFDKWWNSKVTPVEVFLRDRAPMKDESPRVESAHATHVAGLLIYTSNTNSGMAQEAKLYSSGLLDGAVLVGDSSPKDWEIVRTFQFIALKSHPIAGKVIAINHSAGRSLAMGEKFDGSSLYTRGVDFVASAQNTLIVLSGVNDTAANVYPRDGYNVLTVRSVDDALVPDGQAIGEEKIIPRMVNSDSRNLETDDPVATRRILTHLVAPGPRDVASIGEGGNAMDRRLVGTSDSMAAPLVTGTVALLQEYARKPNSGLGVDAKQDEVMKAILMNSADKIFGLLDGMTRTVLGKNGNVLNGDKSSRWLDSPAADTPNRNIANPYDAADPQNKARQALPLDIEMGAGFLNADRALRQLKGGQFAPNADAGRIGWDYRSLARTATDANPTRNVYKLPELRGGSYISATLTWNRDVAWTDSNSNTKYDENEPLVAQPLANMDMYLVTRGETDLTKAWWSSNSAQYNLEHFFLQLPQGNRQYDLIVVQNTVAATNYGLAWWSQKTDPQMIGPRKIEGIAWSDVNGNGTRESALGEEGLAGVNVQLLGPSNEVLDEVPTDFAGAYQFSGLESGDYTIRFEAPARASVTLQNVYDPQSGADDTNDSDVGAIGTVSVHVSQNDLANVDAGYTFNNAPPVGVADAYIAPHSSALIVSAGNGLLANDTDPENDALTAELFRAPDVGTLTLAADGSFTYNFTPTLGFSQPVTFEYRPADATGPGDPVTVSIQISNNVPVAIDDTVATSANAAVNIAVLANDFDNDADQLTVVDVTQGQHGSVEFTANGVTYTPDATWYGTDTFVYAIDDGFGGVAQATVTVTVAQASVAGRVWDDLNGDGLQGENETGWGGVTLELLNAGTSTVVASTSPSNDGIYSFASVAPGTYDVRVVTTYDLSPQDQGPDDTLDSDFDTTTLLATGIQVNEWNFVEHLDVGLLLPRPSLSGRAWLDANGNGIRDMTEGGLAGVQVFVLNTSGGVVASATTAAGGSYAFEFLPPGMYQLQFVLPPQYKFTTQNALGSTEQNDSDAGAGGYTDLFNLMPGQSLTDWDAGFLLAGIIPIEEEDET